MFFSQEDALNFLFKFLNILSVIDDDIQNFANLITSKINKAKLPTHVELSCTSCSITRDSVILLEQIRTIDKRRLREKVCHLDEDILREVNRALKVSFSLDT